jgi:putative two-component system response regulator
MDLAADALGRVLIVGPGKTARELETILTAERWTCICSEAPVGVLFRLHLEPDVDVVLLTPDAFFGSYSELCRQIKFDSRTALVSVVFALRPDQAEWRTEVYSAGADDCIQLPAPPAEITVRLSNARRIKRATDSLEDATAVISSLANAIEGRDPYTRGHVERVGTYAMEIGRRIGVSARELSVLRMGGIVHDIGKVAIPDQILNKAGKLSDEEMELVKRHPAIGFDILKPSRTFRDVLPIVRWHHERPNGTGYPDGIGGDELPLLPRIIAVADVFDALSTTRSYRPAFAPAEYTAILRRAAEKEELDPALAHTLFTILDESERALTGQPPTQPAAAQPVASAAN